MPTLRPRSTPIERVWRLLDSVEDGLLGSQGPVGEPAGGLLDPRRESVEVGGDEQAAQRELLLGDLVQVAGSGDGAGGVVLPDGAHHCDSATYAQRGDRRFEVVAADGVEVDVDAVGRGPGEVLVEGAGPVVDGGIECRRG